MVEQRGGLVDATGDGGASRPEDRPVHAFDGDIRTAWRVGGANPAGGERLVLRTARPVHTDRVTLVQAQDGRRDRVVTRVRLRFDHGAPRIVDLGRASLSPRGQVVRFPSRTVNRLEIELLATSAPHAANPVGFAEVRLDGVHVTETVRPPVDLARRARERHARRTGSRWCSRGSATSRANVTGRTMSSRSTVASCSPMRSAFQLAGTARVNPNAHDETIDAVLGTVASGATFSASSHLAGDLDARASRAFDGDPATAWTPALGPQKAQFLDVSLPAPVTVDHVEVTVVADGRHSIPKRVRLVVDGAVRTLKVPAIADGARAGATRTVRLDFPPVTGHELRFVVDQVRRVTGVRGDVDPTHTLPMAIVDLGLAGVPKPAAPSSVPASCRGDLVEVDGRALPVRITGSAAPRGRVSPSPRAPGHSPGAEVTACNRVPASTRGSTSTASSSRPTRKGTPRPSSPQAPGATRPAQPFR